MKRTASFVLAVMVVMSIALTAWAHYVYPSDAGRHTGSAEFPHSTYVQDSWDGYTAHQHKAVCVRHSVGGLVWYTETLYFYHVTPYARTLIGTQGWGSCNPNGGGSGW